MHNRRIHFTNRDGHKLAGLIDTPAAGARAWALFAHCFTCSKNLKAATHIVQALNDAGIAVMRFDFTGLGQSEGDFADTSFSSNASDLIDAARWLASEYSAPALLVGHSLGGTAALRAAGEIPYAVAVATIGSPADPAHVKHLFGDSLEELERDGSAEVNIGGRPFRLKQSFVSDLEDHDLLGEVSRIRRAILVMHAPLDTVVEIDNAAALFVAAKHPKSFISLDDADHLLSNPDASRYAGSVLAAWASKYIPETAASPLLAPPGEVAARTGRDGFRTEIASGPHRLVADEPVSVGGTDLGPTPYDLLSAALASCTTMTLRMYAEHKGLDLTSATVRVQHGKTHAKDCQDCETKTGKVDEFLRELTLEGNLTDAERDRMVEIADKCPVHRTLHSEIKVRTQLAE
jgi:putative redox protein